MGGGLDDIDAGPIVSADELLEAANTVCGLLGDGIGGSIDSGIGMGSADIWFKLNGVEYYMTLRARRRLVTQ